ncbi:NAALAD2 [Branchiostoma lanceolatum]|uniref:Glutamate carboxypeptidase 2 n=1 Tax=Branchiostoma lanceolatum TaxID=7740 RepID=A0A8J9ZUN4_BRALA|nr:NAALAD2 [Branchiostoma lanceolatum]
MAEKASGYRGVRRRPFLLLGTGCALFGLVLGIIIGYFAIPKRATPWSAALTREGDPSIAARLQREVTPDNIRENLRELTARPHIAGKEMDLGVAQLLRDRWLEYGFDSARLVPYDVLLAYPSRDPNRLSRVSLLESDGTVVVESQQQEAGADDPEAEPPFNAYSGSGEVQGDLVYVNFARAEDFQTLVRDLGVDVTGKVCIARYGKIFRGDKVNQAGQFGCAGLILYSDPEQCVAPGMAVWPDGWMMPSTGVQRGTVKGTNGDVLTPFYPANEYAYRLPEQDAGLPTIPVHPISYGVAVEILRNMAGPEAPLDWQGGLDITYHLGPGYTGPANSRTVRLVVNQDREVRTTYNVIGTIRGAVEPDRYVIVGNHHDAWVYGGVDPSSGTAVLLELARAMGKLKREGWRPRRTVVFGSWGAEEEGLIGSGEFVEDYIRSLQERTVAYLNCDAAAGGNFSLSVAASPLLHRMIREASKKVPDPHEPSKKLYDTWRMKRPEEEGNPDTRPKINKLGAGSDHAPFFQHAGIASSDMLSDIDPALGVTSYPLYHSAYETFDLQDRFIDPGWTVHQAVGRLWGEMAVTLADALVLPLDVRDYAAALQQMMDELRQEHGSRLSAQNIGLEHLESAIANFTRATTNFHQTVGSVDKSNPLTVRAVNDRLMKLEGAFIDPLGLPDRPWFRHVAFAPSSVNTYAGQSFPGLADALFDIDNAADQAARWEVVKKQLAVTTFTVQSAANTLVNNLF